MTANGNHERDHSLKTGNVTEQQGNSIGHNRLS